MQALGGSFNTVGELLKSAESLTLWSHYATVLLHQGSEIGEKRVSRLKEIKPRVPYFSFRQRLQEMVPILGHELSGQLDCLHLLIGEMNVGDLELISRGWVKILEQFSLLSLLKSLDLLSQ